MDWRRGYTAHYYATLVDPETWQDTATFQITGGTVKVESSNLRASADLDVVDYTDTSERLIRVWLDTTQEGEVGSHTALFTGYTSSPNKTINGVLISRTLQCYSVLLPASDVLLPRGWYAPVETDGISLISSLLNVVNAPVDFSKITDLNRTLKQSIVSEQNESRLSMTEKVLDAMNWRMWIAGDGTVYVGSYDINPVATFDSLENDIIEPSLTVTYDWFECPNVLRVVMDDQVALSYDYDSDSPSSINNRGREVWYEETDVVLNDNESLQEFADRRMRELRRTSKTIEYDRRFMPNIYPFDVVRINYPRQQLTGNYMISSQTIELGFNCKTSEEVMQV